MDELQQRWARLPEEVTFVEFQQALGSWLLDPAVAPIKETETGGVGLALKSCRGGGALVSGLLPCGAAAESGLIRENDVIIAVNGRSVGSY